MKDEYDVARIQLSDRHNQLTRVETVACQVQQDYNRIMEEQQMTIQALDELSDSGGSRFSGIDSKLVISLEKMIKSAGDQASEVALEIQQLTTRLIKVGKAVKGRQIIYIVLESFRAYDRLDLVFGVEHLYKLTYPGDKKMGEFKQRWLDIIAGIRPDSVPDDEELRTLCIGS